MEIKIDTKKDSAEEIQHMIDFLSRFISAQESTGAPLNTNSEPAPEGLFGMFGAEQNPTVDKKEEEPSSGPADFKLEPY